MKTQWDYTALADAYLERPAYSPETLEKIIDIAGIKQGDRICDIGAGVAHLTIPLAEHGFLVDAVEPNDAMRANGRKRTEHMQGVSWSEGTGEATGRPTGMYDFVSFGSSFNVCDRTLALRETHRLLKPGKWFCCLWNHRDLHDPIQSRIEALIKDAVPQYQYGLRREDQSDVIATSGLFSDIQYVEGSIMHVQSVPNVIEAWRSHATLARQAGENFLRVVQSIETYLAALGQESISIPYTTRAWMARVKEVHI